MSSTMEEIAWRNARQEQRRPAPAELCMRGGEWAGAVFSADETRRYSLWRFTDKKAPSVMWLLLNPSTADENDLDPTLRRCLDFTTRWGAANMMVANLFPYRATNPNEMIKHYKANPQNLDDVVNVEAISNMASKADLVVFGWGVRGVLWNKAADTLSMLEARFGTFKFAYLELTNTDKQPKHPLYIAADKPPISWVNGKPMAVWR